MKKKNYISRHKQREDGLAKKIEHLASFPRLNPNPVIEVDEKGKIVFFNPAAQKLIRKLKIKNGPSAFLPEDFKDVLRIFKQGRQRSLTRLVRIGKFTFLEALSNVAQLNTVRIYAQDITKRINVQEELKKAHDILEFKVGQRTRELAQVNKQLSIQLAEQKKTEEYIRSSNALLRLLGKADSRKDYTQTLVKLLKGWSNCRCVGIRLIDEEKRIPYDSYVGFSNDFWEKENWLSLKNDQCACIRVISGCALAQDLTVITKGGSFFLGNSAEFLAKLNEKEKKEFRGTCIKNGFMSIAIIPIRYKDNIIGAIHLADEKISAVSAQTIEFIESLTLLIGQGINKFNLEDRIRREHRFLDAFFSHSLTPVIFLDKDFNFIRVNEAYARSCQRKISDFLGRNHFELYPHAENQQIFRNVVKSKQPYQAFAKPFIFEDHPEWGVTYWDWTLVPILDENSEVDFLVFSLIDVTERKQAEDKLIVTQKEVLEVKRLSDIGTLAATVAHELRNPLAAIRMAAYNIKRKKQDLPIDKHLENIDKKIIESDQIITNLLFYSRLKVPQLEAVEISKIIDEAVETAKSRASKQTVKFVRKVSNLKGVSLEADPLQLKELFGNILNNAVDAVLERKGKIEITSRGQDNGALEILITDNGTGIDQENLQKIFEPFFTTKAKGTGLGLTVCQQIVNLHNGDIAIKSIPGKSTTVKVILPLKRSNDAQEDPSGG
ncbi:MAG: ATP-binding protein [Candidatus Omnitrophica bacterium]|nr:ATP-binding protein [Candidatus Omnitrophota bacterium]